MTFLKKFFEWKFLLSSIALILGWLMVIGWFGRGVNPNLEQNVTASLNLLGGMYILLGTSAYRSCKRRMLGLRESTWTRRLLEAVGVLVVVLHSRWVFQDPKILVEDPFVPVMIPLWILVAYLVIVVKSWLQKRKNLDSSDSPPDAL